MKSDKLIKMSKDIEFVGINREDESSFRPGYILKFVKEGGDINISVNDGFVASKADQPYFIAKNCYSSRSVIFSLSQLNNAISKFGLKIKFEEIPVVDEDDVEVMYNKSSVLGLCKFQPKLGGGLICKSCQNLWTNKCVVDTAVIERFNDGIEYCYIKDEESKVEDEC